MKDGLTPQRLIYSILDKLVNIGRSIPFIILLAVIMPVTRFIVGTSVGTAAVTVPLVLGTIPFYARQIQNALLEVDPGVVEAARAMGVGNLGIIYRVYFKEGLVSIIRASSFTVINLIGLTAMAGTLWRWRSRVYGLTTRLPAWSWRYDFSITRLCFGDCLYQSSPR
jgi:D-methionine transport system permease protein